MECPAVLSRSFAIRLSDADIRAAGARPGSVRRARPYTDDYCKQYVAYIGLRMYVRRPAGCLAWLGSARRTLTAGEQRSLRRGGKNVDV